MAHCPLCSDILLRHIRSSQPYWLCRRCRFEILGESYPIHDRSSIALPLIPVERLLASQVNVSSDRLEPPLSSVPTKV
ncbi:MAG TPA: hypothetical protein V6C98_10375 [Thermosynechococcaceae cyanobacterium]|jgi:hypothetical protein